ncbi:MAG: glycosyltransferase family 2 protein [Actinomycetaceae bacterium]|nr:glycosyltransferase family 2 protein [Actinomycetaceae bacterium]
MYQSSVTTVIVTEGKTPYLERTLRQTVSQVSSRIVVANWGKEDLSPLLREIGKELGREISLPGPVDLSQQRIPSADNLGQVLRQLVVADPTVLKSQWLWILHDDSAPQPGCLLNLVQCAEEGRTIGIVGPKYFGWDNRDQILEVGITTSRSARRLERIAPGEIDQGQYDNIEDVLAVGTAGMLISTECWRELGGLDPALGPYGDGLELCRRARLAGYRVVLAPAAGIEHARASYRNLRFSAHVDADASFGARRKAQIYNVILPQPTWGMVLVLLTLPFLSLGRALWRLLTQQPSLAQQEINAGLSIYTMFASLRQARARIRAQRKLPWKTLRPLEATNRDINRTKRILARRERETAPVQELEPVAARLLHSHQTAVRSAALVGTAVTLGLSLYLTRGFSHGVASGAWVGLPASFSDLWVSAWSGWVLSPAGQPGPIDPMLPVMAIVSAPFSLLGLSPQTVLFWGWRLSPMAAWLSMFAASSALTQRVRWRVVAATLWLALPSFLLSWSAGHWPSVFAHVAIPLIIWGWLRLMRANAPIIIRGAQGQTEVRPRVYTTSAGAVASAGLILVASAGPWTALASLVALVALIAAAPRRWKSLLATIVPAFVFLIPTWIAIVSKPRTSWQLLLSNSGGTVSFQPATPLQLLLGMPAHLSTLPTLVGSDRLFAGYGHWAWALPFSLCLLGAVIGLLQVQRWSLRAQVSSLAGALAVLVAILGSSTATDFEAKFVAAWPALALSVAAASFLIATSVAIKPQVLQEASRGFLARRRAEKSARRLEKAERARTSTAVSDKPLGSSDTGTKLGSADAVTKQEEESSSEAKYPHADERRLENSDPSDLPGSEGLRLTTPRERLTYPLTALATFVCVLLPSALILGWSASLSASESDSSYSVTPAHANLTPAAAEEAQQGIRRARLLVLEVSDQDVTVALRRFGGPQLAESSPMTRLERARVMASGQDDLLLSEDLEGRELGRLVATLLTSPETDASGLLHAFAVEQIALIQGQGSAWEDAATALARNKALSSAGAAELGQLWRVRPNGEEPARVRIVVAGASHPVPSGVVSVNTQLGEVDLKGIPAGEPSTLVLAEQSDPHWSATLNGKPLETVDYGFQQAFQLPATSGNLRIRWWSDWMLMWWIGAAVSTAAVVIALVPLRRRIRTNVS